jgi:hypothetical protein
MWETTVEVRQLDTRKAQIAIGIYFSYWSNTYGQLGKVQYYEGV